VKAKEEIGVEVAGADLKKIAELTFTFPHRPDFDQVVYTYITETWSGEPVESEEMKPEWYKSENIPFDTMWPDDKFWVPHMIEGKLIKGSFTFGEGDVILDQNLNFVESF
jgi:8-oxo-dGTP diphosphatase